MLAVISDGGQLRPHKELGPGVWLPDVDNPGEENGTNYVMKHLQNQLGLNFWSIFPHNFCICIVEMDKIMYPENSESVSLPALTEASKLHCCEWAFVAFPVFYDAAFHSKGSAYRHLSTTQSGNWVQSDTETAVLACRSAAQPF